MLLEEAFLGTTLRTAHQADGTASDPRQHHRSHRGIVIGELPLGYAGVRINDALAVADLDRAGGGRRDPDDGRLGFQHHGLGFLVIA